MYFKNTSLKLFFCLSTKLVYFSIHNSGDLIDRETSEDVPLKTVQFDSKTPDEAEQSLVLYPADLTLQVKVSFWL